MRGPLAYAVIVETPFVRIRSLSIAALLLAAGCTPKQTSTSSNSPMPAPAPTPDPVDEAADADRTLSPSLAELYPSLGDEELARADEEQAPSPEIAEELAAEEEFLAEADAPTPFELDVEKLQGVIDYPIVITPEVEKHLVYFQTRGRKWYATWLARSTRYLPMMKEIFRENGLPEDLTYLAMIESGFSTKAWSRARASGPWQFMKATGSRYGLDDDWWVDERRDPELATRAAAAHLKDLYEEFGDWYLAAAAYNAGAGKINRAIGKYGTRDFFQLIHAGRYLRPETKNYVPKLIAATIIAKHPEQFGFTGIEYLDPLEYETVAVPDATDLAVVAKCVGIEETESLVELNPSLKRFCTPPGAGYEIRVPKGTAGTFAESYAKIDAARRVTFRRHTIRQGETLSEIARKHGTGIDAIMKMNHLASARKLRVGQDLVIPIAAGVAMTAKADPSLKAGESLPAQTSLVTIKGTQRVEYKSAPGVARDDDDEDAPFVPPANRSKITHELGTGETLWGVSLQYGVSVSEIKRWNRIRNHRSLQAGKKLTLYVTKDKAQGLPSPATLVAEAKPKPAGPTVSYKVKPGDTVWDIAREHKVDPLDLLKDNNLSRRSTIKPGDVLEIRLVAGTP